MRYLRYAILGLILWGFPTFALFYINPTVGSATSYLTILLLGAYFTLDKEKISLRQIIPFLLLGISYYLIAGLNYEELDTKTFFMNFLKFILVVIFGAKIALKTSVKDIYIFLILGALSVVCHSIFFPSIDAHFGSTFGRFSGFYLNPNLAALICLTGFALSFGINNTKLKLSGQLVFTFAGLLTLSRSFFVLLILMNLVSIINSKKNLVVPAIGAGVLILILAVGGTVLKLNTSRFEALESLFDKNAAVKTNTITSDSRNDTWATYTDVILDKPFVGNGYRKLQGGYFGLYAGVHNTYLLVLGEAGIIPFLVLMWIAAYLMLKGLKYFKTHLHFFLLAFVIVFSLLVGHTYFEKFSNIFLSVFLYINFLNLERKKSVNHPLNNI